MLNFVRETVVSYAFIERNFNLVKLGNPVFQLLHR